MKSYAFILFTFFTTLLTAQVTYLQCGALFDAEKKKFLGPHTILIEGNQITAVKKGHQSPSNSEDRLIDLKSKTIYPGFIDMHVHIEGEYSPDRYLKVFQNNPEDVAYDAAAIARRTLMAGFTAVRDMGGTGVNIALRNAINNGKITGPRIFTAGKAIGTTGGHADPTNGFRKDMVGDPGPKEGVINSVDDAKKAVRQRYKNGADWIKITATGGVLSVAKSGQNPQFTEEELAAITQTAADYGFKVAAHAHGDEGMYRAVANGVKTIEHGTLMEVRTMELMKAKQAYLVATISAGKFVAKQALIPGAYPEIIVPKALAIGAQIQETFKKAYEFGVPIAFGTDAGVYPHGENANEFIYMNEAGMPIEEALHLATYVNAALLDMGNQLGQIKAGFLADIVATDQKADEEITTLTQVSFVMKNGEVIKQ
ncbi:MAG: amidohydrolase family protein [Flavobacteriia bacterium]|nr:amidohydrolase family protein [Flavobacteriia bacterium]